MSTDLSDPDCATFICQDSEQTSEHAFSLGQWHAVKLMWGALETSEHCGGRDRIMHTGNRCNGNEQELSCFQQRMSQELICVFETHCAAMMHHFLSKSCTTSIPFFLTTMLSPKSKSKE